MRRRVLVSTLFVSTAGSLLHFAWDWSGNNPLVAVFAATNESTWEHLKLAFWPAIAVAFVEGPFHAWPPGWLPATAVRSLLPAVVIAMLFYGYTSAIGTNYLAADIGTFIVAVFLGQLAGEMLMWRPASRRARVVAAAALIGAAMAFSTFSFSPPRWFLFQDPSELC